jgi:hypothetical protein
MDSRTRPDGVRRFPAVERDRLASDGGDRARMGPRRAAIRAASTWAKQPWLALRASSGEAVRVHLQRRPAWRFA